ncbi:hypothetical protein B296_00032386 [Ensete ventricosum]|uniref:Uncharacterized protein n=1 Tax=Ensete ventricosum TaxID=4639 RepID=A0A426Z1Q8_ENSVE|nr:hypothetical protein B296_00032386 [Ensete ventricosum]
MSQVAAIAAVCVQSEADYRPLMTDSSSLGCGVMIQWEFAVSTSVWDGKMEPGFRRVTPFKIREVEVDVGEDYRYTYCSCVREMLDIVLFQ